MEEILNFDELAEKYPDQVKSIESSTFESDEDFEAIYDELEVVSEGEGASSSGDGNTVK